MKPERRRMAFDLAVWITTPLLVATLLGVAAEARTVRVADNATWRGECGSCHVAYPPSLLASEQWRRIMSSLDRHFGADASVDPKASSEIAAFLAANAGRDAGSVDAAGPLPRITDTRWFRREHREVGAATFRSAAVGGPGNCGACHAGAAQGNFDEHSVRVPVTEGRTR